MAESFYPSQYKPDGADPRVSRPWDCLGRVKGQFWGWMAIDPLWLELALL